MALVFCKTMPPKVFWGTFGLAFALALPGWIWRLTVETVRVTVARKSDIREVHFDIFQNIALGVKTYLWTALFCWLPGAFFMYPLAMIHMAMPVTKRGWANIMMLSTFFRNFLPTMYFWVVNFVTSLIFNVVVIIVAALVMGTGLAAAMQSGGGMGSVAKWSLLSLSVVLGLLAVVVFSFVMIFNMRVIGLLAYYFKDTLDLVVLVSEKTYVRKEVKVDAFGVPIKTTAQKVGGVLFVVGLLVVVAAVAFFVYYQLKK